MRLDIGGAFRNGNTGLSIWTLEDGRFQVNVKNADGAFSVGIKDSMEEALRIALHLEASEPEDVFDLL